MLSTNSILQQSSGFVWPAVCHRLATRCSSRQALHETFLTLETVIGSLNINSLCGKFDEVQELIEAFDILCIQETKIDRSFPDSQFAIKGYIMYRRDRKKGGGGIVVYIRESLPSYSSKTKTKEMEAILVDFQVGKQHISLLCGYKPPSVNNNIFTDEMYTLLDAAISNRPNIICLGDLNCDILHPLDNGKEELAWLDICDIYDLQNLITAPTRISRTKQSCIDIIVYRTCGVHSKLTNSQIVLDKSLFLFSSWFSNASLNICSISHTHKPIVSSPTSPVTKLVILA